MKNHFETPDNVIDKNITAHIEKKKFNNKK